MTNSEALNELFTALAKAQGAMGAASKGKVNPHFRSSYADLASVWDAIREPLSENGLAVVQITEPSEHGVAVRSILGHSSGQFLSGLTRVPVDKSNAQGFGSALTYARRYGLMALVGVVPDDDDGNAAASAPPKRGGAVKARPPKSVREEPPGDENPATVQLNGLLNRLPPDVRPKVQADMLAEPHEVVLVRVRAFLADLEARAKKPATVPAVKDGCDHPATTTCEVCVDRDDW